MGRFRHDRRPLSAIALHADTSAATAILNDYGGDEFYARQVRAHGRAGDVLVAFSTSGCSPNILAAARGGARDRRRGVGVDRPGPQPVGVAGGFGAGGGGAHHGHGPGDPPVDGARAVPGPRRRARGRSMSRQPPIGPAPVPLEHRRGPLVVVGDSFLDVDVHGSSTRLCPDAPVPVVDLERRWHRPGGAGLAALLAARTGVEVVLITALGADADGEALRGLWPGITVLSLSPAGSYGHQDPGVGRRRATAAARCGRGPGGSPAATSGSRPCPGRAPEPFSSPTTGGGMTALPELRDELAATARRIPVVWDPHPRGQPPVPGCRVVTPNSAEVTMFSRTDEQGRRSPGLLRLLAGRGGGGDHRAAAARSCPRPSLAERRSSRSRPTLPAPVARRDPVSGSTPAAPATSSRPPPPSRLLAGARHR